MNNLPFLLMVLLIGFSACQEDGVGSPCGEARNERLVLTIEDEATYAPSRVSVFFKVETSNGTPIAGLQAKNFKVFEQGRNDSCPREISEFESRQAISNKGRVFKYNTMLILDLSASVTSTSLLELKSAAKNFIDEVMPDQESTAYNMGIWWFDGSNQLHELISVTTDKTALKIAVDGISGNISDDPSTDLYGAVIKGVDIAEGLLDQSSQQDIISAVSMVIFTDGTDQASRYLKNDALDAVNQASKGVKFFTIGLGSEIDESMLTQIGKSGFASAADQTELENTFRQVAELISNEANSYYLFEYCSPKRDGSGNNKLRIEGYSKGDMGSVTTSFDATGFTSGCN